MRQKDEKVGEICPSRIAVWAILRLNRFFSSFFSQWHDDVVRNTTIHRNRQWWPAVMFLFTFSPLHDVSSIGAPLHAVLLCSWPGTTRRSVVGLGRQGEPQWSPQRMGKTKKRKQNHRNLDGDVRGGRRHERRGGQQQQCPTESSHLSIFNESCLFHSKFSLEDKKIEEQKTILLETNGSEKGLGVNLIISQARPGFGLGLHKPDLQTPSSSLA